MRERVRDRERKRERERYREGKGRREVMREQAVQTKGMEQYSTTSSLKLAPYLESNPRYPDEREERKR